MDNSSVYNALRTEIISYTDRIWKTRSWAVILAGAAAALCLRALAYEKVVTGAIITDPILICALTISVSAALNIALWIVTMDLARGIVRLGTYLWAIEEQAGLSSGPEHWALFRHATQLRTFRERLLADIQFWLALAYASASLVLIFVSFTPMRAVLAIIALGSLGFGLALMKRLFPYRAKAVQEMSEYFLDDSDQYNRIEHKLDIKLPRRSSHTMKGN